MAPDPRDARYYSLRKKTEDQLTRDECKELIAYCEKMLRSGVAKKARREWSELRSRLSELLE